MSDDLVLGLGQVALALVGAVAAGLILRRRVITRRGGVVECFLLSHLTGRWQHGFAEYQSGELRWHRSLSLRLRPHRAFDRRGLVITSSRMMGPDDAHWFGPGTMIVTCRVRPKPACLDRPDHWAAPDVIELAMSQGALTGYLAWLEAAPASHLSQAS